MFKRYHKASQSPIPSWTTNKQVLIIFFCAFRNKGEGAPAISDLVQRENNGTGYWIVNMSDSYWGRQQYVIYCCQLRATPSADCNISHIAVGLSSYLIHRHQSLRNGKTCGVDSLFLNLKADVNTYAEALTHFFHSIWTSNTIPRDWTRGPNVKLPKKLQQLLQLARHHSTLCTIISVLSKSPDEHCRTQLSIPCWQKNALLSMYGKVEDV